jgi:hypothetical protein
MFRRDGRNHASYLIDAWNEFLVVTVLAGVIARRARHVSFDEVVFDRDVDGEVSAGVFCKPGVPVNDRLAGANRLTWRR